MISLGATWCMGSRNESFAQTRLFLQDIAKRLERSNHDTRLLECSLACIRHDDSSTSSRSNTLCPSACLCHSAQTPRVSHQGPNGNGAALLRRVDANDKALELVQCRRARSVAWEILECLAGCQDWRNGYKEIDPGSIGHIEAGHTGCVWKVPNSCRRDRMSV